LKFKFCHVFLWILLFFAFAGGLLPCFGANSEDASSAISDAEAKIVACYSAVADAAKAGANVSELLIALNDAGWLLSEAKLACNMRDFDSAVNLANECQSRLNGVIDKAESLKLDAEQAGYLNFMVNVVGSGVGALCVVVGSLVYWKYLEKRGWTKERA
jgi:hypothetical protein